MNEYTVLLVDDDDVILKAFTIGIKDRGFNVIPMISALSALEILKTLTPDIIITDLKMEPMNGFDFYQEVKKLPHLDKVPLFFLTALDDPLTQKFGNALGVDAYICKPVDLNLLIEKIEQAIFKS